jgi:hypothetical protein
MKIDRVDIFLGIELNKENLNFYLTKGKKPVLLGKTF